MNKKSYQEFTKAEKMLVGYIYDLYFQWLKDCHLPGAPTYLKSSMFTDFLSDVKVEADLKYYADYLYLCEYKDENLIENEEHRFVVPKTSITLAKESLEERIEYLNNQEKEQSKSFWQKLLKKA